MVMQDSDKVLALFEANPDDNAIVREDRLRLPFQNIVPNTDDFSDSV